jgi:hypothetical protein
MRKKEQEMQEKWIQQTEDPIYQIMIAQLLRNLHNLMMPLSLQMMSPEAIKLL